ncbi:MAG: alpha/beta hydrolase [Elioraea sp.]|nr:alpha/beta hydrolase [Elioraea sp.]
MNPRLARLSAADGLGLAVRLWGEPTARTPLLCLPGLVRTGGDFARLAARHATDRLVVALDYVGRGLSDRATDWRRYRPERILADVLDLCAALHLHRVVIVGTSMGGLLAMGVAAARPRLLSAVALNDIGPEIGGAGLAAVKALVGREHVFPSLEEAAAWLRLNLPWLSLVTAEEWREFAALTVARAADGTWRSVWDPRIERTLEEATGRDLWPLFGALAHLPVLVVRGGASDVLSAATARRMKERKPDLAEIVLDGVGHAPTLSEPAIAPALDTWLAAQP